MKKENEIIVNVNMDGNILKQYINEFITEKYTSNKKMKIHIDDSIKLLLDFCYFVSNRGLG